MVLMAALFFTVQGFSQAHAASNGDLDHTHEGVACDVTLIVAEQDVLTPPTHIPSPAIWLTETNYVVAALKPDNRSFESRAPPPRGPPL